jgi:hypothetical protein
VRAEELGERHAVRVVLLHPQRQRLGAAQDEPGIEGAQDRALGVLDEPQPVDVVVAHGDDDAADAVAVAVEVLGGAVGHQVGAELDRTLNVGARERVVDDEPGVVVVGEIRRGAQVGDPHDRVGRRLDEQHPRRRLHRPLDLVELRRVHVGERQVVAREDLVEEPERAAVGVVRHDDVVAGLQHRGNRADGRHARREGEARLAGFDGREVAFERHARRILRAAVLVALVLAELFLHVGRRLVDRSDDGAGGGVGFLAGVEADGAETRTVCKLHDPFTIHVLIARSPR